MHSGGIFDLATKEKEVADFEARTHAPDFWNDNVAAQKIMQQINRRKMWLDGWNSLRRKLDDAQTLRELAAESSDASHVPEIQAEADAVAKGIEDLEFRNMLSGEDDMKNCVLNIHAGAGGTEAQDWAEMLSRMD